MIITNKVRDIMIPLKNYPVASPEETLYEATMKLRTSYCQIETGMCTETGPRTILILEGDKLVGILDFRSILKVLVPEVAGGIGERLRSLGVSLAFAEVDSSDLDESRALFRARVLKNAHVKTKEIMLKIKGTIEADANLIDALKTIFKNKITVLPVYEGERLIGVVRDTDLFLAMADILKSSS